MNFVLSVIFSTLVSTGLITLVIKHWYDKKLRAHDVKISKYMQLIKELAKFVGNQQNWDDLGMTFNEALLFASDEVVGEILEFNKKFTENRKAAEGKNFSMTAEDVQSLIVAIRKDLYLKSKSINTKGLAFFQKP